MSGDLQKRFKELAKGERVYVGRVPSQNDLCALFTVRAAALYLRSGGKLAFVLPLAALTRGQFEKLRSGSFDSARIQWDEAWTMGDSVQQLFQCRRASFSAAAARHQSPCLTKSAPIPARCPFGTPRNQLRTDA
jgi:hypothetical protein